MLNKAESLAFKVKVLDFRYVAAFQNHSASTVTLMENQGKIYFALFDSCKI